MNASIYALWGAVSSIIVIGCLNNFPNQSSPLLVQVLVVSRQHNFKNGRLFLIENSGFSDNTQMHGILQVQAP